MSPAPFRRALRLLGWALVVAVVAICGWSGWREYDYRAAVREARAAGFDFTESPTPFAAIRYDWHDAFRRATWLEHRRELYLPDDTDLAPLRPLLLRLDPTRLDAPRSRNVDALRGLTRLRTLDLRHAEVKNLAPLAGLAQLQWLDLRGCTGVTNLAPLAGLTQLQVLFLGCCTGVADLAPLAGLAQMQVLDLGGCTGVADFAPLAGLVQLQELGLGCCKGVADLAPLRSLTQIQKLYLDGCAGLSAEAVAAFKAQHPKTIVSGP